MLLIGAVSLLVGLSTATASSPVGPHEAEWSTTLNYQGRFLHGTVSASLRRTTVVGIVSVGIAVLVAALLDGSGESTWTLSASGVLTVTVIAGASLLLTLLTLLAYEIEHVGDRPPLRSPPAPASRP